MKALEDVANRGLDTLVIVGLLYIIYLLIMRSGPEPDRERRGQFRPQPERMRAAA